MFSNSLVCDILEYINKNLNDEITIDDLANRFYFDKTYIMKRFKREIKLSIHEYINSMRIYNSLIYFSDDNYIISIAFKNGFNSLEYFSEIFKNCNLRKESGNSFHEFAKSGFREKKPANPFHIHEKQIKSPPGKS